MFLCCLSLNEYIFLSFFLTSLPLPSSSCYLDYYVFYLLSYNWCQKNNQKKILNLYSYFQLDTLLSREPYHSSPLPLYLLFTLFSNLYSLMCPHKPYKYKCLFTCAATYNNWDPTSFVLHFILIIIIFYLDLFSSTSILSDPFPFLLHSIVGLISSSTTFEIPLHVLTIEVWLTWLTSH